MDPRPWIVLVLAISIIPLLGNNASAEDTRANNLNDDNDTFETAQRISEGSKGGMVADGGYFGNDTDFYVISVPWYQTLGINIERFEMPWPHGEVILTCYENLNDTKPKVFLVSGEDGKKDVDYWVNRGSHTKDIYIKVSGDGMYFIETITFFDLSNLVEPYLPPVAITGIFFGLCIGFILGLYITRKNAGGTDQGMQRWMQKRKKGKTQYILQYGILFGLILTLVSVTVHELIDSTHPFTLFMVQFLIRTLIYIGGGLIFAFFLWRQSEKAYNKWIDEKENEKRIRPRWGRPRPGSIRP